MNAGSGGDEPLDEGPDGGLLDVLQHPDHHRAAPPDHPEDRGFSFSKVPRAPFTSGRRQGGVLNSPESILSLPRINFIEIYLKADFPLPPK